jgi:hypothetical protein
MPNATLRGESNLLILQIFLLVIHLFFLQLPDLLGNLTLLMFLQFCTTPEIQVKGGGESLDVPLVL